MTTGHLATVILGCAVALAGAIPPPMRSAYKLSRRTYYVDAEQGSDSQAGTSPQRAWRSLARANEASLGPGDRLLFASGQRFAGTLRLAAKSSGLSGSPITIRSFGSGRAVLDGGAGDGIVLEGCSYVDVDNLNVMGCGRKLGSDGAGIRLLRTTNVEIANVTVSGFRLAGVWTSGDQNSRLIRIHAHDNGAAGIMADSGHEGIPRSRNLYIAHCIAENNPGDPKNLTNHSGNGIVVGGVDGVLIEYCEALNNGWDMPREGNGPVGIWGWNCDRLVIQRCISHDNKSPGADGGGFDFDGGITNSRMQYNLSYNNQGCGYLLCQYGGAAPWKNNIVRYNISVNDGSKNLQAGIGLWRGDQGIGDAEIYNNTIVNPVHAVATLGDLPRFVYRNNIFLVGGDVLDGSFTKSRFENNLYWSTGHGAIYRDDKTVYKTLEEWAEATGQERVNGKRKGWNVDPQLTLPAVGQKLPTDPHKLRSMPFYRLSPVSAGVAAGTVIPDAGDTDLYDNRLPVSRPPSLGAHEPTGDPETPKRPLDRPGIDDPV